MISWNQVQDRWQQFNGRIKSKWTTSTADDPSIMGMRDLLIRKLRSRYDVLRVEAGKQVERWTVKRVSPTPAKAEPSDRKVE